MGICYIYTEALAGNPGCHIGLLVTGTGAEKTNTILTRVDGWS